MTIETVPNGPILEPFAGAGDLFAHAPSGATFEAYDIEPNHPAVIKRDTILNPPDYRGRVVLTNPPYLARNKSREKDMFNQLGQNDLYKCFLVQLVEAPPAEAIIILPVSFISSMRRADVELRGRIFRTFWVRRINIFEYPVFKTTTVATCAVHMHNSADAQSANGVICDFYSAPKTLRVSKKMIFSAENNFVPGGEVYNLPLPEGISRWTSANAADLATWVVSNIQVSCIDGPNGPSIGAKMGRGVCDETPNRSMRAAAAIVFQRKIQVDAEMEVKIVGRFNEWLGELRAQSESLFLPMFREDVRKRMPFDLVYKIIGQIICQAPN